MKVLYIAPYPPLKTGVADYAKEYKEAVEEIAKIEIFNSEGTQKSFTRNSLKNIRAEKKILGDKLKKDNFDLIHFELSGGSTREFYLCLKAAREFKRIPLVLTIHDPGRLVNCAFTYYWLRNRKLLRRIVTLFTYFYTKRLECYLVKESKKIIVFTELGKKSLNKRFGKSADGKISIIPMGVAKKDAIRPEKNSKRINLIYFGFISKGKGIEVLLSAFKELLLKLQGYKLNLYLVGGSAFELISEQKHYEAYLKKTALDLGVLKNVDFVGYVKKEQLGDIFKKMHIMIIPHQPSSKVVEVLYGKNFATSGAMIRGLSFGLPMVVSNSRALKEEIEKSKAGMIFDYFSSQDLARKIESMIKKDLLEEYSQNAIKHIEEVHDWQKVVLKIKELYEKTLTKNTIKND